MTKKLKKNIVIHKAVIKGHNPQHLLRVIKVEAKGDTIKFWVEVTGESLFAMAALKINESPDTFSL